MAGNQIHQGKKLKEYLGAKGFNLTDLAAKLGTKRQYFYKWFLQETLNKELVEKLTLVTGFVIGEMTDAEKTQSAGNIAYVPVYVQAGFLRDYQDIVYENQLQRYTVPGIHGQYYDLEVRDYSMYDLVSPGDRVFGTRIESFKELLPGNIYMLQDIDGMILKIFHSRTEEEATFKSYNLEYPEVTRPLKSIKVIYRVDYILADVKRKNFGNYILINTNRKYAL